MAQERSRGNTEEEKGKKAPQANKKKRFILIIIIFAVVLLLSGIAAVKMGFAEQLLLNFTKEDTEESFIKEPDFMYEVPEILVNLSDGGRGRFLSVKFYLGYDEPKLEEEIERRMPEIRDLVNTILWDTNAEEISAPEGKENLRTELLHSIDGILCNGELRGVYFWHVLIQ
ncbi:MAG: flagellar basal body-associated FliL family protein [Bacillota bacterium]|nr:flagellar basal body-associated FliL family protein [Bacillota bacterium]